MLRRLTTYGRCLSAMLILYWAALFVGTHIPNFSPPRAITIDDKVLHFLGYAGLAFLAAAYTFREGRISLRRLVFLLLAVVAYGILDELLQIPVPGRQAEFGDWLADIVGVLTGAGLYIIVHCVVRKYAASRPTEQPDTENVDAADVRKPSNA